MGDVVKAGDVICIVEAMKMENELRASAAGVVRAVSVTPGSAVEKGAVLVEFDPVPFDHTCGHEFTAEVHCSACGDALEFERGRLPLERRR
jgi:pyruvate/2-oxoglutarate dehydrogenase complex dihydrolipoamide acyltransferase (E2) component